MLQDIQDLSRMNDEQLKEFDRLVEHPITIDSSQMMDALTDPRQTGIIT